jgi:chemotaxis response regulator CheB
MRKCCIYTDKALDVNILSQLSGNLTTIIYDVTDHDDPPFVRNLIKAGIPVVMISKLSEEELNKKKIQYFDLGIIQKIETFTKDKIKDSDKITSSTLFKTNKLMLSGGRYYASNLHRLMGIPLGNTDTPIATVLDYPKFYEEAEFFYIFNKID